MSDDWCTYCAGYFENLKWDGDQARCPNCESTKWFDIKKEAAIAAANYHKGKYVTIDYDPYP